jgi:hypothetical protein
MALFSTRSVRWMLLLGSVGLLLAGTFASRVVATTETPLAAAYARWSLRPFDTYRLVVEESAVRCRQDVAVRGEGVVKQFSDTCRTVPWTVAGLFMLAERNHSTRYPCVDQGCACDTVMTARVQYDAQLGYPNRLEFRWAIEPNLRHFDFWEHLLAERAVPQCRALAYSQTIQVVSLTPMP